MNAESEAERQRAMAGVQQVLEAVREDLAPRRVMLAGWPEPPSPGRPMLLQVSLAASVNGEAWIHSTAGLPDLQGDIDLAFHRLSDPMRETLVAAAHAHAPGTHVESQGHIRRICGLSRRQLAAIIAAIDPPQPR